MILNRGQMSRMIPGPIPSSPNFSTTSMIGSLTIDSFVDQITLGPHILRFLDGIRIFPKSFMSSRGDYRAGELKAEWKPNVVAIQETHLNPGDKLKLVNYTTYITDRLTHHGGGTALFIRNSIDHYPTPIISDSFENTTIAINLRNSQQITVSNIYRRPHGIICADEVNRIFNSNNGCIAVGDFNDKHSAWSLGRRNQNVNIINDYICNNNLILPAPPEPTHFPHNSNNTSTLDFGVLKNFSSGDASSLNKLCRDHNPVSVEIDINANIPAITKTLKTTNWMKFYDIAKEAIPGNTSINSTKDIDEVINKITAVILTAINQSSKAKIIKTRTGSCLLAL
ncbi:hypothetical protein AVEN_109786-1 [Araneus ventricosus]|uniref:Endonuclease/exonuclease/phosphatase domain-containing protein n=1 Tax=Araneus ventricosus TaxID=182803 RepID=A0A4Y2MAT9_ARAVE|nr:hypothetical protein AVEN_109786-1 [Araneus ventricosus]